MANNLTGDYEAVLQLAGRQINGLLATLHQNGVSDDAPLKLLHSADMSIGFPNRHRPDVTAFAEWLNAFEPVRGGNISGELIDHAPAGAAARFRAAFNDLLTSGDIPPAVIRGRAKVQISSVRFSAPSGSTSEVILETAIRAQYTPVPDTNDLPEPIHGEVRASFVVHRTAGPKGWRLVVQPSPDDTKIRFLPALGSGLNSADAATLSEQLRKTLREGFSILPVDLPA